MAKRKQKHVFLYSAIMKRPLILLGLLAACTLPLTSACPRECYCFDSFATCSDFKTLDLTFLPRITDTLILTRGEIEELPPALLIRASRLKIVEITSVHARVVRGSAFRGIRNLDIFTVSNCTFDIVEPDGFSGFSNVNKILISESRFGRLGKHAFGEITGVKEFKMWSNHFEIFSDEAFYNLENIVTFQMYNNNVTYLGYDAFVGASDVYSVTMFRNFMKTAAKGSFDNLANSTELMIMDSNVFECTCDITWMLDSPSLEKFLPENKCVYPGNRPFTDRSFALSDVNPEALCQQQSEKPSTTQKNHLFLAPEMSEVMVDEVILPQFNEYPFDLGSGASITVDFDYYLSPDENLKTPGSELKTPKPLSKSPKSSSLPSLSQSRKSVQLSRSSYHAKPSSSSDSFHVPAAHIIPKSPPSSPKTTASLASSHVVPLSSSTKLLSSLIPASTLQPPSTSSSSLSSSSSSSVSLASTPSSSSLSSTYSKSTSSSERSPPFSSSSSSPPHPSSSASLPSAFSNSVSSTSASSLATSSSLPPESSSDISLLDDYTPSILLSTSNELSKIKENAITATKLSSSSSPIFSTVTEKELLTHDVNIVDTETGTPSPKQTSLASNEKTKKKHTSPPTLVTVSTTDFHFNTDTPQPPPDTPQPPPHQKRPIIDLEIIQVKDPSIFSQVSERTIDIEIPIRSESEASDSRTFSDVNLKTTTLSLSGHKQPIIALDIDDGTTMSSFASENIQPVTDFEISRDDASEDKSKKNGWVVYNGRTHSEPNESNVPDVEIDSVKTRKKQDKYAQAFGASAIGMDTTTSENSSSSLIFYGSKNVLVLFLFHRALLYLFS